MSERNPYEVLGVSRTATEAEIKAAYRKLARTLHPDVNKAADAQQKFSEVQAAYDVLSDPEARRRFDRTGSARPGGFAGAGGGASWSGDFDMDDLGSMFDSFFRGRGGPVGGPGGGERVRARARGKDAAMSVTVGLEAIASGRTIGVTTPLGERVDVRLPKGCADGASLRVGGKGHAGAHGGPRGDLLITVAVSPHAVFTRGTPGKPDAKSLHLTCPVTLTVAQAVLGDTVEVPLLGEGGAARVTVPASTPSGRALRLRGRGLEGPGGERGDVFAVTSIAVPEAGLLSEAEKAMLQEISSRTGRGADAAAGKSSGGR